MNPGTMAGITLLVWIATATISYMVTRPFIARFREEEERDGLDLLWYLHAWFTVYPDLYRATRIAIVEPEARLPAPVVVQGVLAVALVPLTIPCLLPA